MQITVGIFVEASKWKQYYYECSLGTQSPVASFASVVAE
jgi:hypothetical protein